MEGKKKRKGLRIVIALIITVVLAGAGVGGWWMLTEDSRAYKKASELLRDRNYLEASVMFEELGDYSDSGEMLLKCYYELGRNADRKDDYDEAIEWYNKAGDYSDACERAEENLYDKGHAAFLDEEYDTAFTCFESLEKGEEAYGHRHFVTLEDADEYLEQQLEDLNEDIRFYIGEKLEGESFDLFGGENSIDVYQTVINRIPYHTGTATYDPETKEVWILVLTYYQGDVILDAWENGTTEELNEEQTAVLELALELTEQAKAETDSDIEMEMWLHDWLCRNIEYESPDMDVSNILLARLRQLSCIGAMLDGKANCQGYTDAFYLLGNIAGLDTGRVFGDAEGGHVWNTVLLEGERYIVDVTFDDNNDKYGGWTYTHFNAPWDPNQYVIDGGEETVPDIAREFNKDVSCFGIKGGCFSDKKSAAKDIIRQLKANKKGWAYVVIENTEIEWEEFDKTIDSVRGRFGDGKTWVMYVEHYAGNTYVSVKFV